MTLAELIETQLEDIQTTMRDAQRATRTAEDLALPAKTLEARIARINGRIERLQAQRDETVKRLEAAIAEQTELRDRLEREAKNWSDQPPR